MSILETIVIAVVEGLTEFLPVSSTGHMIITERLMNIPHSSYTKMFTVAIQLGAILSVIFLYRDRFTAPLTKGREGWLFYAKLLVAVIPAMVLGKLFDDKIESLLESPLTVSISLFTGGFVLLFIDNFFKKPVVHDEKELSFTRAFVIGIWQCVAMVPGISRSAASIIGGMQQQLSRGFAAEFSFFLAIPTMAAATTYSLFFKDWNENGKITRGYELIFSSTENIISFLIGNVVAFIVAMLAIKFFIGFLQEHGFRLFGWYRIITGAILLLMFLSGYL